MSESLRPHGLQHARLPCPSPTPGACSNSRPLSQTCHPTISSSVIPFSSCLQSFPVLGSFQMSQFFASGGQNIGPWASASVLSMNIQDQFPLGLTIERMISISWPFIEQSSWHGTNFDFYFFNSGSTSLGWLNCVGTAKNRKRKKQRDSWRANHAF